MYSRSARGLVAALILLGAAPAAQAAASCAAKLGRSMNAKADPADNVHCSLMGQVYCRLADFRDHKVAPDQAAAFTKKWMDGLGTTGSHLSGNWSRPALQNAATYIYARPGESPWALRFYAEYACAVLLNTPGADPKITTSFDAAAGACIRQHDDASRNEALRGCLRTAYRDVVKK